MELIFQNNNLTIYNSIFEYIDSNMYMIIENNRALIIDPHKNDDIANVLFGNEIYDITIVLTHEHPDHISGLKWLKDNFNTTIISTKETSDYISDIKNTRPILITFVLEEQDKQNGTNLLEKFKQNYEPFATKADITFEEDFEYVWNTYLMDQNACSSPQLIYWVNDNKEARDKFWDYIYDYAQIKYPLQDAICVENTLSMVCESL